MSNDNADGLSSAGASTTDDDDLRAAVAELTERVEALEDELRDERERRREAEAERDALRERLEEAEERADRADRVGRAAVSHVRQLWHFTKLEENRMDSMQEFAYKTLQGRVRDLEHDRVDVSDLVNAETETHDLEIQRKTAARLAADREDSPSPLDGNKHRMTFLWRHFIENATKTKGGKLKLDSAACRTRLERYAGIRDPNTNTVRRSMKMMARHTRRDGGVSDPGESDSDANLVQFEPGERGGQKAALVADEEEFREFCTDQARAATMDEGGPQEAAA